MLRPCARSFVRRRRATTRFRPWSWGSSRALRFRCVRRRGPAQTSYHGGQGGHGGKGETILVIFSSVSNVSSVVEKGQCHVHHQESAPPANVPERHGRHAGHADTG